MSTARPHLILASASSRRLDLLAAAGIVPDRVEASDVDETPLARERPGEMARRLAVAKVQALALKVANSTSADEEIQIILGADTVVACGRRILPKPADDSAARASLSLLSGRRHRVYTGIATADRTGRCRDKLVSTVVAFKRLTGDEIEAYVAGQEWRGKAGGYAIQGRAAAFVRFINGSYTNVVGLPLYETLGLLQRSGYPPGYTVDGG